jgi:hypothetical protein
MRTYRKPITQKTKTKTNTTKNIKQFKYTQIKKKKLNLKKYQEKLDKLINVRSMPGKAQIAEIQMTQAQKSIIYITLLQLMLIGTDNSIKMAKEYSKKAGMDYSKIVKDSKKPKPSRKVGSMRVKSTKYTKKKPSVLRTTANWLKNRVQTNKEYYKKPQVGDGQVAMGLGGKQ